MASVTNSQQTDEIEAGR